MEYFGCYRGHRGGGGLIGRAPALQAMMPNQPNAASDVAYTESCGVTTTAEPALCAPCLLVHREAIRTSPGIGNARRAFRRMCGTASKADQGRNTLAMNCSVFVVASFTALPPLTRDCSRLRGVYGSSKNRICRTRACGIP